jgi:hypothetical protein
MMSCGCEPPGTGTVRKAVQLESIVVSCSGNPGEPKRIGHSVGRPTCRRVFTAAGLSVDRMPSRHCRESSQGSVGTNDNAFFTLTQQ